MISLLKIRSPIVGVRFSTPHYQELLRLCLDHPECGCSKKNTCPSTTNTLLKHGAWTQKHLHLVRTNQTFIRVLRWTSSWWRHCKLCHLATARESLQRAITTWNCYELGLWHEIFRDRMQLGLEPCCERRQCFCRTVASLQSLHQLALHLKAFSPVFYLLIILIFP